MNYYGDYGYAHSRLVGTWVVYPAAEEFVYVSDLTNDGTVYVCYANSDHGKAKLEDLEVTDFKLGYTNFNGEAAYLVRIPKRRDWRQGIRPNTLGYIAGGIVRSYATATPDFFYKLLNSLMKGYPTFQEAMELVKKQHSAAFHKDWAVDYNYNLLYRGSRVGDCKQGKVKLRDSFNHLKESLAEAVNASA